MRFMASTSCSLGLIFAIGSSIGCSGPTGDEIASAPKTADQSHTLTGDDLSLSYTPSEAHMVVRFDLSRFISKELTEEPAISAVWSWGGSNELTIDRLSPEGEGFYSVVLPTTGIGFHQLEVRELFIHGVSLINTPVTRHMSIFNAKDLPEELRRSPSPFQSLDEGIGVHVAGLASCGQCLNPTPINGGGGSDILTGTDCQDDMDGRGDDDTIHGGNDRDTIHGGRGDDHLYGDECTDYLYGEHGDDWLYGGDAIDYLYGGDGSDNLFGEGGNDYLYGGDGQDLLHGGPGNDYCDGQGNANDTFTDCETAIQ